MKDAPIKGFNIQISDINERERNQFIILGLKRPRGNSFEVKDRMKEGKRSRIRLKSQLNKSTLDSAKLKMIK